MNHADLGKRIHCTGTLFADNVVLTAAHCLYDETRHRWLPAEEMRFVAGYQRGTAVAASRAIGYVRSPGFNPNGSDPLERFRQDWALLLLDRSPDLRPGILAVAEGADTLPGPETYQLVGYAGLRPHVLSRAMDCGPPSGASDRIGLLLQRCSAMLGDSGAPLIVRRDGEVVVVGMLVGAVSADGDAFSVAIPSDAFAAAIAAAASR